MKRYLFLFFLIITSFWHVSAQTIPQVIDTDDVTLTSTNSPYTVDKSIVVSEGRKLIIEKGVVLNFTGQDKYIDVRGLFQVAEGVTINMTGKGTQIKTEGVGKLEFNGTSQDSIFITGANWKGIEINNSGSTIKYSSISVTESDHHYWNWFINLNGSSMENSRVSKSRLGVSAYNSSTLSNNKIHNLSGHALELSGSSIATGNIIYDVNLTHSQNYSVRVNGSTFNSNRIYQTKSTTNNYAITSQSGSTIMYNTIGGSTGSHGSVGIAIRYDNDHIIKYNNIGGYYSNIVIHGYKQGLEFEGNSFFGEMNSASGQRNVTIVNGQSSIVGYNQWGDSFNSGILSIKINLENNFWGNTSNISGSVIDYNDEIERKGIVDYEPNLSAASELAPISIPGGVTKAVSGSDVILTWDAVTASDLAGYKIYTRSGEVYTLLDIVNKDLTSFTVSGGDISTNYAITSYDNSADGSNDQLDGSESWYSDDFSKLVFTLSVASNDAITTVGPASLYDKWLLKNNNGDSAVFNESLSRANDWNYDNSSNARGYFGREWDGSRNVSGLRVYYWGWHEHSIVEVNDLIKTLSTSRSEGGSYEYLGQHNGHSYFRSSWGHDWDTQNSQAILDGGYLAVINDDNEATFLSNENVQGWVGYYSEKSGTGYTMPGVWKWIAEQDPETGFNLRLPEAVSTATITATLDRKYGNDVTVSLSTGGSATVTDDYTLSSTSISIPAGSTTGTSTLTTVQDNLDEDDRDTVKIEVGSSTYAGEASDQILMIAIEDDDTMPGVTLTASADSIAEAGGTSNLTATLSVASGRDVTVGLVMEGTAGSSDYTAGGKTIDLSEVLTDSLVLNYTFSGNANDQTSNNNNGTVNGASLTTDRFGEANSAYQFDGVNDHISVPLSSSLQIKEDITINVWVNKEASDYWTDFIVRAPGEYYEMRIDQRENNTAFEAYGRGAGSWDHVGSGSHIDNGEWVMLSFISASSKDENGDYTTSKNFKFYVNGELRNDYSRIANRYDLNTNESLMIGSNQNGDNNNFKGKMDELRIYNKALTDQEIKTLYSNTSVQNVNASITIAKGSTEGTLEIKGVDDETGEADETVKAKIVTTSGASETGDQSATIVLKDDDATTISLSAASAIITEGTEGYATLKVSLDKASELPVTVNLSTSGVDATDFIIKELPNLNTGENVTFLPSSWGEGEPNNSGGEHYAHITGCDRYNDHQNTSNRRHVLEISKPYTDAGEINGYSYLADYDGHAYYLSNNSSSWTDAKASTDAVEDGYLIVIATEQELDFINDHTCDAWIGFYQDLSASDYSEPLGGWTWVNSNYNAEISQVIIPAGQTEVDVYVLALDDEVMGEGDETLTITIGSAVNGVAGNSATATITIKDNDIKPDATLAIETTTLKEGDGKYSKVTANLSVATTQDVKVNLALTGTASTDDYDELNDTVKATTNGLVAHYTFDGDANDQSGNNHNGTVTNATLAVDRHGESNKAYSFDGNNSYIEVPWSGSVKVQDDITMSAWVNIKDKSDDGNFNGSYGRVIYAPNEYYEMYLNWNGGDGVNNREIYARSGGHGYSLGQSITEGQWKNIVYTYTSDTLRIYVDGVLSRKEFRSWSWNYDLPNSGSLFLGARGPNNDVFLGSLDDIRIYNRALSATEISTLYTIENVPPVNGAITVAAGQTSKSIYLSAVDDETYEGTETAKLTISSVNNGQAASSGTSVDLSIEDNDGIPSVTLTSDKDFIGESNEFKEAVITATASGTAGDTIKVILSTSGTGTKDTDYELTRDTIFILPGNTTGTIKITAKFLAENDPTEGEENVTLDIASVIGATESGTQSITLKITETSCDSVDKEVRGNVREDLTLFELCSPYTVGGSGFKVRDGYTLTLEKNAVLNFTSDDQKITIEGKLVIKEGATINMSNDSYILTEDDGQLVIEGTATNRVTITGESWEKYTNNSSGPGLELNSTVASTIKYADIINSNVNNWDWMVIVRDGSIIENSSISGGKQGLYIEDGTIKDSKVHSFRRKAMELSGTSSATGNEFYDSQLDEDNQPYVQVYGNSTFKNNRIYSTSNTTKNWALYISGDVTVENNTIGGSTGQHGAVGIGILYDRNATIKYNNIGGYQANVAVHGHGSGDQSYTFSNNTFIGTLSGNQRHVVVYDGNNKTDWHTTNIPNYDENGEGVDTERINFENNYWGTTTTSEIDDAIQDTEDDLTFDVNGFIDYTPYSTSASITAPISTPANLTKAVSGSDVVLTWDAVSVSDLAGYKIYTKSGDTYTLLQDITDESLTTYTVSGGSLSTSYVITAYDDNADGTNDQSEGYESWYSFEFTTLSYTLSASSSEAVSTIGAASTFDNVWGIAGYEGDSSMYQRNYERVDESGDFQQSRYPVAFVQNDCTESCNENYYAGQVYYSDWHNRAIIEVNSLITSLSTSRSSGSYKYLGQYNGHSYFRTSWNDPWETQRDQAIADGGYLVVINSQDEFDHIDDNFDRPQGYFGYYATQSGSGKALPGDWKWVSEQEPKTGFDLRLSEAGKAATITATLDRVYGQDVTLNLITGGTTTLNTDYTLSTTAITISAGATTGTSTLTTVQDALDEADRDTVRIQVGTSTYATETTAQKILISIEDDDALPGVTLTASQDTIVENGGVSNLTATLSAVSGREVSIGVVMEGTAGSSDFTAGGNVIDISEILPEGLVANYTFIGNADDATSNNNSGTVNGATLTTDRFGEANSAYQFDGVNDNISIPFSSSLQIDGDISFNVWMKGTNGGSTNWSGYLLAANNDSYWLRTESRDNNTAFTVRGQAGSNNSSDDTDNITNDTWTMVTFTSTYNKDANDPQNEFKIYVDGELQYTRSRAKNRDIATDGFLMIGSQYWNGDYFKGVIDDLRIYNKALSAQEVSTLYTNTNVQSVNATITIAEGSTSGTLQIKSTDDVTDELDETIISKIMTTAGASETGDQSATIVISDDDETTVNLTVSSDPIKEGDNSYATVTATLDKKSEKTVSVYLKGSGVDATDYRLSDDTLSITTGGLAAHYTFDGNANDVSGNGNDGTVTGATLVADRFGNANSAYEFSGSPDYVKVPQNKSLEIKNNITMSFWAKLPSNEELWQYRTVIDGLDGRYQFSIYRRGDNEWEMTARGQLINQETGTKVNTAAEWNHFIFTQEPDGENNTLNKLYFNGALVTEQSIGRGDREYPQNSDGLLIGTFRDSESENAFRGQLDDVRIYSSTLNASQIKTLYDKESQGIVGDVISISPGDLSGVYYALAEDDTAFNEPNEKLTVSIDSIVNGIEGSTKSVEVTIKDNDIAPTATISKVKGFVVTEGKRDFVEIKATLDSVTTVDVLVGLKGTGAAKKSDFVVSDDPKDTISSSVTASLAAHYTFSGNANDVSGNDNNGTVNGAILVSDRFGKANGAYQFDGINDNIEIPFEGSLRIEKDITLSAWVYVENSDSNDPTILEGPSEYYDLKVNDNYNDWVYGDDIGEFSWAARSSGYGDGLGIDCCDYMSSEGSHRAPHKEWIMITYTLLSTEKDENGTDIENRTRAYYNGQLINESIAFNYWNLTLPTSGKLYIGGSGLNQGRGFKGKLDDIRIYDGALTTAEIAELYASEFEGKEVDENTILIPAGITEKTVYLFAADDDVFDEGDELLNLEIDTVNRGKKGTSSSIQITVKDNDYKPTVSINATNTTIKEGSNYYATVEAEIDGVTTVDVVFSVSTTGDASDNDYVISIDNDTTQVVANLAAHYNFNGNVNDISGNGNDGIAYGVALVPGRFGNDSSALYFDGNNDRVEVPFAGSLRIEEDITMNAWINVDSDGEKWHKDIINSPDVYYQLYVNTWDGENDQFRVAARAGGFGDEAATIDCINNDCSNRPKRDTWYMVTYTFGKELETNPITGESEDIYVDRMYLNGILVDTGYPNNNWDRQLPNGGTLWIGGEGNYFKGLIDDIKIYDGALSPEQVSQLYSQESSNSVVTGNTYTIPAGSTKGTVYVFAVDDEEFDESAETLTVSIDSVIYGTKSTTSNSVSISIEDNDVRPDIALTLVSGDTISEGSNNNATIKATLSEVTTKDVTISLGSSGSAVSSDFDITLERIDEEGYDDGPSIAAYYTFDGNADDMSGNNNNGVVKGATLTEDRNGKANSAYFFDGENNDRIEVDFNSSSSINIEKNITFNLWIKGSKGGGSYPNIYNHGGYWHTMSVNSKSDNYYNLSTIGSGSEGINSQYDIPWEEWVMVTYVSIQDVATDSGSFDGVNRKGKLYINGQLTYEAENLNDYNNQYNDNSQLTFGNRIYISGNDDNSSAFKGKIDDIRIYDGILSDSDILKIYQRENTGDNSTAFLNSISIPSGSLSTEAYVYAVDDEIFEGIETLSIVVDTTDYGSTKSSSDINIVISDNDNAPEMSLSSSREFNGEVDGFNINTIEATLTNPVSQIVRVPLVITGSADTSDYSITSDTIIIEVGETTGSVTITVSSDSTNESNENIIIRAIDVQNASDSIKQEIKITITEDVCSFIDTDISGNVFEDLTLYNLCTPYNITGDLLVGNGATLTIEPGVKLNFEGPHSIKVDGGFLKAIGTEKDSITITGISWRGIDVKSAGSEIKYARIIDEGNSGQGDYLVKLSRSHIDKSHVFGGYRGVELRDSSIVSRSRIHDIRKEAVSAYERSVAYGNTIYDVGTEEEWSPAVMSYGGSYIVNNRIYSTMQNPNMVAVGSQSNGYIGGNTIGADRGVHGKFGIFITEGYDVTVEDNRIGGFKTNVALIGTKPVFEGNTFMGEMDLESKYMNVRVATQYMNEANQDYPGYISKNNSDQYGWDYQGDRQTVDMVGNYWSNVSAEDIPNSIFDYDDRFDLKGEVDFANKLDKPSSDAPITPPRNVIKSTYSGGVQFRWTPNEEADLAGYRLYYDRRSNGTFENSLDMGSVDSYVLAGGNINNDYYITAYDTDADGEEDQIEGHESWFTEPANAITIQLSRDESAISEDSIFNTALVTVELSSSAPEDVTVSLVAGGQATPDEDYVLSSSTLTVKAGELSANTTVVASQDDVENEGDEIIELSIGTSSLGSAGFNSSITINIAEDICQFIPNSISGSIEEDLVLYNICNPYYITGNVLVREGVTLTVEPGVTVVFNPNTYLRVNGTLIAEGTETDSITFTGDNWNYIDITNNEGGSRISYAKISDESENGNWYYKVRLKRSTISHSLIENVMEGVSLQDSSSVTYTVFRDIYGAAIQSNKSVIYGNEIYRAWRCPGCNGVKPSVQVYNESVFRNNIVQDVAGATAVEVGGNSIVERNIIGDYKGSHGVIGILVRNDNNHTIRYNKIGGFTANVVLLGTSPTFTKNSFIGELDYNSAENNVLVGSGNINVNDSVRYDIGIGGNNYNEDNVILNMKGNFWENVPNGLIEKSIYDYNDNFDARGEIVYTDELSIPDNNTPLTPPRSLSITETTYDNYSLSWEANSESDVTGYNLYTGLELDSKKDVGNNTQTDITIPDVTLFNIGLTAYDQDADGTNDRVEGHESLPTKDYTLQTLPRAVGDTLRVPRNSSIVINSYPETSSIIAGFEFKNSLASTYGSYIPEAGASEYQPDVNVEFDVDRFGTENNAINFDNESHLLVEHDDTLNLNTDNSFAISLWFKLDSGSLNQRAVLLHKDQGNQESGWSLTHNPWNGVEFYYNFQWFGNSQRVYDTEWHHVAVTYQKNAIFGTSRFNMYVDGVRVMQDDRELTQSQTDADLYIGNSSSNPWEGIIGSIDDIVIYNTALSEEQVVELYNAEKTQNVIANDIDLDGDQLTASLGVDVANGTLSLQSNGDVEYTPNADFSGYDSFTYSASDGTNESAQTTVMISVSTPPTAVDDSYTIDEDSTLVVSADVGLTANDTDAENDPITVVLVGDEEYHADYTFTNWDLPSQPDNSDNSDFAIVNGNGFWDDRGYNDQFRFVVEYNEIKTTTDDPSLNYLGKWNGHSYFISNTFMNWDNANLVAQGAGGYLFIPNSYAENQFVNNISYNSEYWIGYYQDKDASDYEEPSGGWKWVEDGIVPTGTVINGDLTVNSDGSFRYVPTPNFFGENVVKYFAYDGIQYSDTTTLTITVNAVDDEPIGVKDFYTIFEDDTLKAISGFSLNVPESGMVVYYPFDGNVEDYGPNKVELSVYGNPEPAKDRFGNFNSAYYFDGETDFMMGNSSIFPTGNQSFTVSLWFNSDDVGSNNGNARQLFGYGGPSLSMLFDNPALPSSNSFEVSGGQYSLGENYRFRTKYSYDRQTINNKWHNVIVTYSTSEGLSTDTASTSGELNIYFDGQKVVSNQIGDMNTQTFDKVFTIGAHTNQNGDYVYTYPLYKWFKGSIDDIVVYNRVIRPDEIETLSATSFASVLANDIEVDGEDLSATKVVDPNQGDVTLFNSNGIFVYVPDENYFGLDSMYYIASDGNSDSDTTLVQITVIEVDDPPVGYADTLYVNEDEILVLGESEGVLVNDVDVDGDVLSAELAKDVSNGTLDFYSDGSLTYTPDQDYNGTDTFKYFAKDEANVTDHTDVIIVVNPVNDKPVLVDDNYVLASGDSLVISVDSLGVLGNDSDVDGDTLEAQINDQPANGSVTLTTDGLFTYKTTESNFVGEDMFTYLGTDGTIEDTATVKITVTTRPVAVADTFKMDEDYCLRAGYQMPAGQTNVFYKIYNNGVLGNDIDADGDTISAVLIKTASHGTLDFESDGKFEYCPEENYNGVDSFTYVITDSYLYSDTVTVIINISPVNDLPVGLDDEYGLVKNSTLTVPDSLGILSNDTDLDGDSIFATLLESVANGSLSLDTGGGFTYTPVIDYIGTDKFKYNLSDGLFVTDTINVVITITSRPVPTEDTYSVPEDSTLVVQSAAGVLANDTDEDSDELVAYIVNKPLKGEVLFSSDGSFVYSPEKDYTGADSFTYYASDGILNSDTVTASITVTPVNDAPVGQVDEYSVDEGDTLEVDAINGLLINDTDIDSDSLIAGDGTYPLSGMITILPDGSFVYIHDGSNSSSDTFEYTVSDSLGGTDTVQVSIVINPVDDVPVISTDQSLSVDENSPEGTLVGTVNVLDENIQADLSGMYNIVTDNLWCGDSVNNRSFVGQVEIIKLLTANEYTVDIITSTDKRLKDDFSFGGFFECYDGFDGTPGGSLRIVHSNGTLTMEGASQWGDLYKIASVTTENEKLIIEWANESGEEYGRSTISRTDEIKWNDIISNSGTNVGFDWTVTSGNEDSTFTIDNIGNIYVKNSLNLDYETEPTKSLSLTANDGAFTSTEESVTINVNNVWDMRISGVDLQDSYCDGVSGGSISLTVADAEGEVTAKWSDGQTGLSVENLAAGDITVEISDNVGTITQTYTIQTPPIYTGLDICYVSSDSIDITKNRIFINEGPNPYNIKKFLIYREGSITDQYDFIGEIDTESGEGSFLDDVDNRVKAYRYKVAIEDNCGNISQQSQVEHVTNHLTANQGIGGEVNLIWSGYEGIFVPTYKIFKSTNGGDYEVIDSVSANTTSYSDFNVDPANEYQYFIGVEVEVSCVADGGIIIEHHDFDDIENVFIPNSILESGNVINNNPTFGSSYITNTTGLKGRPVIRSSPFQLASEPPVPLTVEPIIIESVDRIYPNPANQMIYIDLNDNAGDIERLFFVDFSGKVIDNVPFKQTKDKAVVDIDALNSGIYLLDVTTKVGHSRVKVIIQK